MNRTNIMNMNIINVKNVMNVMNVINVLTATNNECNECHECNECNECNGWAGLAVESGRTSDYNYFRSRLRCLSNLRQRLATKSEIRIRHDMACSTPPYAYQWMHSKGQDPRVHSNSLQDHSKNSPGARKRRRLALHDCPP